jgi:nucleotide-binding universal stress UspA family protein
MFRNILIPTDGSDLAAKAVKQGVLFAKEIGAKITVARSRNHSIFSRSNRANSNKRRSNTRYTRRLTPIKCSVSLRQRPSQQVSLAIRFTRSTNTSIRQSLKPPTRESAI